MSEQFSNPRGVVEAVRRAADVLRPDYKSPEQRAREHLEAAAEAVRELPDGWRMAQKIERFTERMFKNEGGVK